LPQCSYRPNPRPTACCKKLPPTHPPLPRSDRNATYSATAADSLATTCETQVRWYTDRLRFSRAQAEGITEALKELDVSTLATKTDLELALAKQTITLLTWMTGMLLAQGALVVALSQYLG